MAVEALNSIGHQQLTVSSSAVGLTKPTGLRPRRALINVQTNAIRWRADGTDPSATVGNPLAAGERLDWTDPMGDYSHLIDNIKFIRQSADATLDVEYFA